MMQYYRFSHHGLSFVEALTRHMSQVEVRSLSLPEVYHDRPDALIVQVGCDEGDRGSQSAVKTLIKMHHGEQVVRPKGEPLSAEQLLELLPLRTFQPAAPPSRLLIRLRQRAQLEALRDELYRLNVDGLHDIVIQAALLDAADSAFDALVFLARMPTQAVQRWLKQADVMVYYPYGPDELIEPADRASPANWSSSAALGAGLSGERSLSPRGVWVAAGRSKPYMTVVDEVLRRSPSGFDAENAVYVWLVEPNGAVTPVEAPFVSLYFLHDFAVAHGLPQPTTALRAPSQPSELFHIDVRLRRAATRPNDNIAALQRSLQQVDRQTEALERQRRRLERRLSELQREAQRTRVLRGDVDETLAPDGAPLPPKRLWLFFDRPVTGYRPRLHWPLLQELILNATLDELRQYRYAYCRFELPATGDGPAEVVGFHLLGHGDVHGPRAIERSPDGERSPQAADITLVQDARWRRLGYNLYVPEGSELYPPLRPDDDRPDGPPDGQLFNALLAQAVFERASHGEPANRLLEFKNTDNLCMLFEHPATHTLLPIVFRRNDFTSLIEASVAHLNQTGLSVPTRHDVSALADTIERDLVAQVSNFDAAAAIGAASDQLASELKELLDQGLRVRLQDLTEQRDRKLDELDEKTANLEGWLASVEGRWSELRRSVDQRGKEVLRRSAEVERFLDELTHGATQMEGFAAAGAQNWEDLAQRMAVVTAEARSRSASSLIQAQTRLEQAERIFTSSSQSIVGEARGVVSTLHGRLQQLVAQVGGGAIALARIDVRLEEIRTQLISLEQRAPAGAEPDGSAEGQAMTTTEVAQLRQLIDQLTLERDALSQELNATLDVRDDMARLRGSLDVLQREVEHTQQQRVQLSEELQQLQQRGDALAKEVEDRAADAERWRKRLEDTFAQLKDRERTIEELQQTTRNAARSEAHLAAALAQLEQVERELERAKVRIEQLEHADRQAHERTGRNRPGDVRPVRETLLGATMVHSDLRRANRVTVPDSLAASLTPLVEGYIIIERKVEKFLGDSGVREIAIVCGETLFDPALGHFAINRVWRPDLLDGVIVDVVEPGYRWHNQILREAQVIVNSSELAPPANESS